VSRKAVPEYDKSPKKFRALPVGGVIEEHCTTASGKHEVRRGYRIGSVPPWSTPLGPTDFAFKMAAGTYWCVDKPWEPRFADGVRIVPFEEYTAEERVRLTVLTWKPDEPDDDPWPDALGALVGPAHADRIWPEWGDHPNDTWDVLLQVARIIDANGGLPRCGDCRALIVDAHCACYEHRKAAS